MAAWLANRPNNVSPTPNPITIDKMNATWNVLRKDRRDRGEPRLADMAREVEEHTYMTMSMNANCNAAWTACRRPLARSCEKTNGGALRIVKAARTPPVVRLGFFSPVVGRLILSA